MAEHPSGLFATLGATLRELNKLKADYMLAGGLALLAWLEPRATTDIDVVIAVGESELPILARHLGTRLGGVMSARSITFKNGTVLHRIVVQRAEGEVILDLILAKGEFLATALARRVRVTLPDLGETTVASAEDLLLMKLGAWRLKDQADAQQLCAVPDLDLAYVRDWARRLRVLSRLKRFDRGRPTRAES